MNILFASSEVHPYSKTGGLADVSAALAKFTALAGHTAALVTPLYRGIDPVRLRLKPAPWNMDVPLGGRTVTARFLVFNPSPGLTIYFVDCPEFFQRDGIYQQDGADYADNGERYIFFSKCVVGLARKLPWRPDILHLHDWQSALVPLLIRHERESSTWPDPPKTCLTIHNLAFQGNFPDSCFGLTNLPGRYFTPDFAEFHGSLNCLKTGVLTADEITTVSPRYAREITTQGFGCSMDGVLRHRHAHLHGILNGVDYDEWNTRRNPHLNHPYSADDLSGKRAEKLRLQHAVGLPATADTPLFGAITRLAHQKGCDILLTALEEMLAADLQFVLLGSGQSEFERGFQDLATRFPAKMAARIGYDHPMAHRIEAAADFFVMPSLYEPCGLNQMYSLRYGAIPVVRMTGGLDDTIVDPRENAAEANGIKFEEASPRALVQGFRKAMNLYRDRAAMAHFRGNGMAADFSWDNSVRQYTHLYEVMVGRRPARVSRARFNYRQTAGAA